MTTTIQVSESTHQLLQLAKEKEKVQSYDAVIRILLEKKLQIPESMFGVFKGMKWKKAEDRLAFHD